MAAPARPGLLGQSRPGGLRERRHAATLMIEGYRRIAAGRPVQRALTSHDGKAYLTERPTQPAPDRALSYDRVRSFSVERLTTELLITTPEHRPGQPSSRASLPAACTEAGAGLSCVAAQLASCSDVRPLPRGRTDLLPTRRGFYGTPEAPGLQAEYPHIPQAEAARSSSSDGRTSCGTAVVSALQLNRHM